MSKMVLMKHDGTYEEMDVDTKKVIYFQSRGYKVYTWKEMFEATTEATTEKIVGLEEKLRVATSVLEKARDWFECFPKHWINNDVKQALEKIAR